jgi:hypothetical protein
MIKSSKLPKLKIYILEVASVKGYNNLKYNSMGFPPILSKCQDQYIQKWLTEKLTLEEVEQYIYQEVTLSLTQKLFSGLYGDKHPVNILS